MYIIICTYQVNRKFSLAQQMISQLYNVNCIILTFWLQQSPITQQSTTVVTGSNSKILSSWLETGLFHPWSG